MSFRAVHILHHCILKIFHSSLYDCTDARCRVSRSPRANKEGRTSETEITPIESTLHGLLNLRPSMYLPKTKAHTPAERHISPSNRNAQVLNDKHHPSPFSSRCCSQLLSPYCLAWAPLSLLLPQSLAGSTLRLAAGNAVPPLLKGLSPRPKPTSSRTRFCSMPKPGPPFPFPFTVR